MTPDRANVLGVGISPLSIATAADRIFGAAGEAGFSGYVTVTGVHGVMESQRDVELKHIHNRSFLTVPDGMPMVWLAHWNGFNGVKRVYGPDLMLEIFRRSEHSGERHFLFGGGEGVVDKLADRLRRFFPGTTIVGQVTPPFRPLSEEEENELVVELQETQPEFLWVGLGTPKQERFMHGLLSRHPDLCKGWKHGLVMFGVGAAFDFHAGLLPQAPNWMQKHGLEWFFRLMMEPRRLWKRYASNNPGFIFRILGQMTGRSTYPLER